MEFGIISTILRWCSVMIREDKKINKEFRIALIDLRDACLVIIRFF